MGLVFKKFVIRLAATGLPAGNLKSNEISPEFIENLSMSRPKLKVGEIFFNIPMHFMLT